MKDLKGKNVLVTCASSGIGQAIAIRFAQEGANVAINYRKRLEDAKDTEEMVEKACGKIQGCGVDNILVQADVSKEEDIVNMVNTVVEKFGRLDILINNAGIQIEGAAHEIEIQDFDKVVAVNLRGAYICAREAIKHFLSREGDGIIINNSSVHEIIPKP